MRRVHYVDTSNGACLVEAPGKSSVRKFLREQYGRDCQIKKITTEPGDIRAARQFGAYVHQALP